MLLACLRSVRRNYEGDVFNGLAQLWTLQATVLTCQASHGCWYKQGVNGSGQRMTQGDKGRHSPTSLYSSRKWSKWTQQEQATQSLLQHAAGEL